MTTRVAVVTGGASGIGRAVVQRLAHEFHVVVWDRDGEAAAATAHQLQQVGGTTVSAATVDVTDRAIVQEAVEAIRTEHGRLDVLVNAAGMAQFVEFEELSEAQWDRMFDVNTKGVFNCTQAVVPLMREHGYGRVVSVSSIGAYSGSPSHAHYAASKAAVIGFSKALCKELGPFGITVNCVAPGVIDTPMVGDMSEEARERYANNPVGRMGEPEDVAHAIMYLASEGAGYTTGWVISMNGGMYT